MIEKDTLPGQAKIRKNPPRRDSVSYQTKHDIVIPAGTILRAVGDDEFAAAVGFSGVGATFSITVKPGALVPAEALARVAAS